jgi:hypothetical protein
MLMKFAKKITDSLTDIQENTSMTILCGRICNIMLDDEHLSKKKEYIYK